MRQEDLDQRVLEHVRPWGMVLRNLRHRVATTDNTSLGQMIKEECARDGVDYPPPDIEATILTLIFKWMVSGAPAPVEEMV